ncbi:MAG: thiamine pyrophosphate-dependent enzyme [Alphaproteobacteria bacterium]|nr:thiamine pyrophosphate-dependent enzyme [Alphaproteobacteria bacterium]
MSSKPGLHTGPEELVQEGMLERRHAVEALLGDTSDMLIVTGLAGSKDDVLAVTGDSPSVFTLSGAMGAAAMMGLGLALAQPDRRVMVVTGDGELLMNVGSLASIGVLNPPNLSIICVDNERYGETGWQESHTGRGVDISKFAEGGCIPNVRTVTKESELADAASMLRESNGTSFVLVKVAPTDAPKIHRSRDASWNKGRFREALLGQN